MRTNCEETTSRDRRSHHDGDPPPSICDKAAKFILTAGGLSLALCGRHALPHIRDGHDVKAIGAVPVAA